MSIGDTLAEARRQAGLTLAQVSQQTRIRESIIAAIEQGDFSPCGGDFYARGHIRSIAGVVGTDPAPLIREYDEEHGPPGKMRAAQIFEPATPIRIREPRNLHMGRVLAVALIAVAGFGAYRLVSAHDNRSTAAPTVNLRPSVAPTVTVTPKAATQSTAPPKNEAVIKLTAISDCWVGLNDPAGQSLYQGIVPAGTTRTWDEKHPVSMVIGNPPGIKLTVNGQPQHMTAGQVAHVSINPASQPPVTIG